jgi:oligoribonuclease NrnB/cAMP/cGMP phosphodiesterase (DHH superfamily)
MVGSSSQVYYKTIITHNDFDGVVSGAIVSIALGINRIIFTGPNAIEQRKVSITERDIVCDLPYPAECGMWFDHHQGNVMALELRGLAISDIAGEFKPEPSCARVVYNYFLDTHRLISKVHCETIPLPKHLEQTVQAADIIDSFAYPDIDSWRQETPGKVVDYSIKSQEGPPSQTNQYLRTLIDKVKKMPLDEIAQDPVVRQHFLKYRDREEKILQLIQEAAYFLPEDKNKEIVIIDLTHHSRKPRIIKNLAFILYPHAQAVIEVQNLFSQGTKTNNLNFSMALGFALNSLEHNKDVGEIMRLLNMGDGHPGAGSGIIRCRSKKEMLAKKETILKEIFRSWQQM